MSVNPRYMQGPGGYYDTKDGSGPYIIGPHGVPVPAASTEGFFAGRQFRVFKELNILNGATLVIRAAVPVNIILFSLEVEIEDGWLRVGTYAGGTPGGTFAETLTSLPANTMSTRPTPVYAAQTILTAGGTHTGGTELDVIRMKTANSTGAAMSVGNAPSSERGVGPGTYFFRLQNLGPGTVQGVFRARWEEMT